MKPTTHIVIRRETKETLALEMKKANEVQGEVEASLSDVIDALYDIAANTDEDEVVEAIVRVAKQN